MYAITVCRWHSFVWCICISKKFALSFTGFLFTDLIVTIDWIILLMGWWNRYDCSRVCMCCQSGALYGSYCGFFQLQQATAARISSEFQYRYDYNSNPMVWRHHHSFRVAVFRFRFHVSISLAFSYRVLQNQNVSRVEMYHLSSIIDQLSTIIYQPSSIISS